MEDENQPALTSQQPTQPQMVDVVAPPAPQHDQPAPAPQPSEQPQATDKAPVTPHQKPPKRHSSVPVVAIIVALLFFAVLSMAAYNVFKKGA